MSEFRRLLAEALDPVLVPAGFASGQYATGPAGSGVTFCAAFDDFRERFPEFPQAQSRQAGNGACVDLVIEGDCDDRITRVSLEELSLEETCLAVGQSEQADRVAELQDQDVSVAAPSLRWVLTALFAASSG